MALWFLPDSPGLRFCAVSEWVHREWGRVIGRAIIIFWISHHERLTMLYAHTSRIYVEEVRLYLPLTLLIIFNFSMQINSQFSCILVYLKTGLWFSPLMVVEHFKLQTDKDQPNLYNSPNWLWGGYGSNWDKYKTIEVTSESFEKMHQATATITKYCKHHHSEGSSGT